MNKYTQIPDAGVGSTPISRFKNADVCFQYYPANIRSNRPIGFVKLNEFLQLQRAPSENLRSIFKQIALAEELGNTSLKANLKQTHLFYYTPCVHIAGRRRYTNILSFTGLLVLDFDHLPSTEYSEDFKQYLFNEYDCMVAAWLSPSKRGVKALVKIPKVNTTNEFKEYYFGISAEMDAFTGFDGSGQNSVLPLFQSYDPNLLYRDSATEWSVKGNKRADFTKAAKVRPPLFTTDRDKKRVEAILRSAINKITDIGHPNVRGAALAAGGFVASGYIEEWEAIQMLDSLAESHPYLTHKMSSYRQTISWGVKKGQYKPLVL